MQGLIDNYFVGNSRDIGACIYCGERTPPLSNEHAVPYGLNGPWTLLRASCESCAKITTRFEHDVMRSLWPDVRNALAMQSRRREKRSGTLPLQVRRNGILGVVQVPRQNYPTYLATPTFPPPEILQVPAPVEGFVAGVNVLHLCGPTFEEASKEYPDSEFVGMRINFSPADFARMIAKIGFCAAVASVGLSAFTQTPVRDVILGKDSDVSRYVGSWWGEPVSNTTDGLHQVRITVSHPGSVIHAIVGLFAQFGTRDYHVVLGPADPAYVASGQWPSQWSGGSASENLLYI